MAEPLHIISSSDNDDSNDSLPDLQSRILSKLTKPQQLRPIHTLTSDDDSEEICNKNNVPEKMKDEEVMDWKHVEDESNDISIVEEIRKPQTSDFQATRKHSFQKELAPSDPFEEDLPDIQNFTILSSGLDHEDDEQKVQSFTKLGPKKLRTEVVRGEKEAKRKEREALKQKRALEKEESKAQKEAERTSRRAMKPGECMKYVKVQLDRHLLELPEGSQVISQLQSAELRYEVVDSPVSNVASVVRIDPLSLQNTS